MEFPLLHPDPGVPRISLVSPEPRPVKTIIASSDVCTNADGSGEQGGNPPTIDFGSTRSKTFPIKILYFTTYPLDFQTFQRLCNVCYKRHETGETSSDKFGRCENKYDITDIYIRICMYVHGYLVCIHWQKRETFSKAGWGTAIYFKPTITTIE